MSNDYYYSDYEVQKIANDYNNLIQGMLDRYKSLKDEVENLRAQVLYLQQEEFSLKAKLEGLTLKLKEFEDARSVSFSK